MDINLPVWCACYFIQGVLTYEAKSLPGQCCKGDEKLGTVNVGSLTEVNADPTSITVNC